MKDKARKIIALLPKKNCGKCGYDNCGEFALAIAGGKVSPYDCRKSQPVAKEIAQIAGIELPEKAEVQASDFHHHHHHLPDGDGHHSIHHHEHHHGGHRNSRRHHIHCQDQHNR